MEKEAKYLVQDLIGFEQRLHEMYPEVKFEGIVPLPAIYYDTADGRLERSKIALRVREENGKLVGCYKATTQEERKFIEEEVLLHEDDLKTDWFTRLEYYPELARVVENTEIQPVVTIKTQRKIYLLLVDEMELEIALDHVVYLDGFAEEERVEVEWKGGKEEGFEAFLHKFELEIEGLQETLVSKYQQAKELLRRYE